MHLRLLIVLLISITQIFAVKTIKYNDSKATTTLPIEVCQYDPVSTFICIGAALAEPENEYAIAGCTLFGGMGNNLAPFAPTKTSIDNKPTDTNPLCGQKINHLRLVSHMGKALPVVVTDKNPNIIYCVLDPAHLLITPTLHDATGADAAKIVSFANAGNVLFAAVQSDNANLGEKGTGICVAHFEDVNGKPTAMISPKATALDITNPALKINHDLSAISRITDMHWDNRLQRLYIGIDAEAGDHPDAGARAIAVGRLVTGTMIIDSFVPTHAIERNIDQIIGSIGQRSAVTIQKIRTLFTSTRLNYLIVARSEDSADIHQSSIYALPLVDLQAIENKRFNLSTKHGTLANCHSLPADRFFQNYPHQLLGRGFTEAATNAEQVLTADNPAAMVGGGPLPLGDDEQINDLFVYRDSVYAALSSVIFMSQALFDEHGRIKNWTSWQRVVTSNDQIIAASRDVHDGLNGVARAPRFIYLTKSAAGEYAIKHGSWNSIVEHPLLKKLNEEFPKEVGGIQELKEYGKILTALNKNKVVIIENNEIETIANEYINAIMPLSTALFLDNCCNERDLFVGGAQGLVAISLWKEQQPKQLHTVIGNYRHIRSLQCDDYYLYVLTNNTFDRIDLNDIEQAFTSNKAIPICTLATPAALNMPFGSFADAIVSSKLGLLATSFGLFRVGNGCDITRVAVASPADLAWTRVNLPEMSEAGSIRQLLSITPPHALARNGMLYVLAQSATANSSRVYRLSIADVDATQTPIDDATVLPINDCFVKGSPSFFIEFGSRRSFIATDGAVIFDAQQNQDAGTDLFQYGSPTVADIQGQRKNNKILASTGIMHMPVRLPSGEFVIPTSTGLLVYE